MVRTVYTTFDGARFDNIKKAKQHEQKIIEDSPISILGDLLHQLKKGETLSLYKTRRYGFVSIYGDTSAGEKITGFGLIHTIAINIDNLFLTDTYNTKYNTLTVRISWYEGGQYSASCELSEEGLQFVQPLELNEDIDALIGQMREYVSDEVHEVLKKAYKGEL
jgi:hypothetical protein